MSPFTSPSGKPIEARRATIDRIIPLEEVAATGYYADMAELAVIFNHDIVQMGEVWRWKPNDMICLFRDYAPVYTPASAEAEADGKFGYGRHSTSIRASIDLNTLWGDFQRGLFSMEEYMKYYMQIGYSLSGFAEVFGQKEAHEYNLPGAKTEYGPDDDTDYPIETILAYMQRVHEGKVLKI